MANMKMKITQNLTMKWKEYSLIGSCLLWLSLYYLSHYRAAEFDNMEALIKMAIAYLYNEGCKYTSEVYIRINNIISLKKVFNMYLYVNYQGEECHHLQLYTCMSNIKILKLYFSLQYPVISRGEMWPVMGLEQPSSSVRLSPWPHLSRSPGSLSVHPGQSMVPAVKSVCSSTWRIIYKM